MCNKYIKFIPYRAALDHLRELVSAGNDYLKKKSGGGGEHNRALLKDSAAYITRIFDTFGLIARPEDVGFPARGAQGEANVSASLLYLSVLHIRTPQNLVIF